MEGNQHSECGSHKGQSEQRNWSESVWHKLFPFCTLNVYLPFHRAIKFEKNGQGMKELEENSSFLPNSERATEAFPWRKEEKKLYFPPDLWYPWGKDFEKYIPPTRCIATDRMRILGGDIDENPKVDHGFQVMTHISASYDFAVIFSCLLIITIILINKEFILHTFIIN